MNESKKNLLPPIVVDYIEKLGNKNAPAFQRDLYCQTLERVRDACDAAVSVYKKELEKYSIAKRK